MADPIRSLTLYDLLAPEFLAGFSFPAYMDQYLSLLAVSDLSMTSDDSTGSYTGGILYTGTVYFPATPGSPAPVTQHTDPSGAIFNWNDVKFQFRLRTWREGSSALQTVVNAPAISSIGLGSFFDNFTASTGNLANSDYPGLRFRLELLVSILTFHLGNDWVPGKMDATYHVVKDTTSASADVEVLLPKITLCYEQPEDFSQAPSFSLESWGNPGFDAPSNLGAGELVTMQPPLALHTSGRVAFGVQNILLDLSPGATPPEILAFFGTGDDFTGVFIQQMEFYYSDTDKDFAFNITVTNALISFQGKVWLEAELDLLLDAATHPNPADPNASGLQVSVNFLSGGLPIQFNASTAVEGQTGVFQGGTVSVPPNVVVQLQVSGGATPYTYEVDFTPTGGSVVNMWDSTQNQASFKTLPTTNQTGSLVLTVTDSTSGTALKYINTMTMSVAPIQGSLPNGAPEDNSVNASIAPATITLNNAGAPAGYQISFTPSSDGTIETLVVEGGPDGVTATTTVGGVTNPVSVSSSREILIEVDPGASVDFSVVYPQQGALPAAFNLLFNLDGPQSDASETSYIAGVPSPDDTVFDGNTVPAGVPGDGASHASINALIYWMNNALDLTQQVTIEGRDSYEGYPDRDPYSQTLSERRLAVAKGIIANAFPNVTIDSSSSGTGDTVAQGAGRISDPTDRVAIITGTAKQGADEYTLTGTLARAASASQPNPTPPPATTPPATPPAASNSSKPPSLKRLSFRVRLEKNLPVLLEISGEIDFQQQTQSALQQAPGSDPNGSLGISQASNSATANPNAGPSVVDFTLNVTYDTATCNLTETLTLGSGPADPNGLIQMKNGPAGSYDTFKNIFGAVMIFTPILNSIATALAPGSAGEWTELAFTLAAPVTIGGLGWINTSLITLYGGTLVLRQNVPDGISSAKFAAAALTFDYGVSFRIDIDPLNIHSSRDLSVRYKAFGFSLNFSGSPAFEWVFDTSKGYTLDLSDPSLFNLPGGLGDLLKIAEARIAQYNPATIECDLVMKVDLGVITVDSFQVKVPLDGSAPMILPSGIHVNIPDVITGSGSVNIKAGGFEGGFDLTLVPLQLRIAAQVGVQQVSDGTRSATAVYLGLEVDFPTPIVLGTSGLGIFGFFGLFAMHYTRNMQSVSTDPQSAIGPDLQWLISAGGMPQNLYNPATNFQNWVPQVGSWAFGVGALLGTIDGFLLTMRGMFVLELPGPQIIITVNLQILADLPGTGGDGVDTADLTVGMLGILDLDFNLGQITIGVSINLNIQQLIVITVPISIFFSWNDPDTWHVWLGTIQTPISCNILGIVKGSGYFMFGGQAITPFPPNTSGILPGVAVAVGFSASIIWGSEDIDIYLEVVVGADLGVSFSPGIFIAGDIHLSGKLQLLIISVGASGDFAIAAPDPFYLHVKVCGSVSFFFFSISACVEFGTSQTVIKPPPPLINQMYLQSYAPVIPSGQGGTRPIDASLGNALETVTSGLVTLPPPAVPNDPSTAQPDPKNLTVVPIDTVPVLQLAYAADASGITNTFTATVPQCPMLPTSVGGTSVGLGGGRTAVYSLTSLTIDPPLPTTAPKPPVVWRQNTSKNDKTATRVDLALFSRDPNLASHALERSTTLNQMLASIWGGTCAPVAPPACVLWTFCAEPLGPDAQGWELVGIPTPDPSGTTRSSPVPTVMEVVGPVLANAAGLLAALGPLLGGDAFQPARIIGLQGDSFRNRYMRALELPELISSTPYGKNVKLLLPDFGADSAQGLKEMQLRLARQQANWRWVRLSTGPAAQVSLYLAVTPRLAQVSRLGAAGALLPDFAGLAADNVENSLLQAARQLIPLNLTVSSSIQGAGANGSVQTYDVLIRERDDTGALLRESTLQSLNPNLVLGTTGLPSEWTNPAGPWMTEILPLAAYMDAGLQTLTKLFVSFAPLAQTTVIEVAEVGPELTPPTVVIGAIQVCPLSEQQRYQLGLQVQNSQIATVEGYLDGGSPVPLLVPNTKYTVTVEYEVETTEADGTVTKYPGVQQGFSFQTDSAPPPKLDPWVLSCAPANNELNVFYDDPVIIVFNDQEAIQLFSAYNYQLVLALHAADGQNDPTSSVSNTTSVSGFGPAGYDSLQNLIGQGLLPCVGATTAYQNQQYTADVTLRPCMAYTLDIVTTPATPVVAGAAIVPLYRTRFTTSKYASLRDLANDLGGSRILHRHLSSPLSLNSPGNGKAATAADQDIESAFLAAGEQALPAPEENTITLYWVQDNGSGPYQPHCILLDCTEPLWRVRQEPSLVPVNSKDPSFTIVEITPTTALEVKETGGSKIDGYVYSTAGTRTVAFFISGFSSPAGAQTVTLELHRPASKVYGLADSAATIISLPIGPQAPWEADHV